MSRTQLILAVVVLNAAAAGCRTAPLPEPYVIQLPQQMTRQQAEVAVLAGIVNKPPPPDYDPNEELSEEAFEALLWKSFVGQANRRSWFPESRTRNTIYASVDTRGLYLRAAIRLEPGQIEIHIVESRNLSQTESRIHRRAIKWIRNLDAHIRREVGRMSVILGPAA